MSRALAKRPGGFTMIEMIVVIVVVAILAASVTLKLDSPGESAVGYQTDRLARDLRHAQALAVAQVRTLRFNVETARYCVTAMPDTDCNKAITDPATRRPFVVPLENGVSLSGTTTDLDSLGRPKDGAALLAAARTFQLTADATSWSAVLRPLTGFVEVASP